tara:strand:- start:747 stop:1133 length:387 start_codon:yes stop_codon:yes gene_type:complete
MDYGYQKTVKKSFQSIDIEIRKNLSNEGFGIITEIDLQKTFKEKLGLTYQKFQILGACNPELARKAIDYEREVGLLMPCNVIFWENEDKTVTISFVDAEKQLSSCDNLELLKIGKDVNIMLKRAIDLI